ncbi:MAG: VOC family protein [Actinobacteria bacterium]|nr:VOC family protein [Actinomycetota bacterium]
MATAAIPYIRFAGDTREALGFYRSVFGGKVEVNTFGDFNVPDVPPDAVMHAALTTDEFAVYAYDAMPGESLGDAARIRIALVGDDLESLTKAFNSIAEGGNVSMPLTPQQWGATYGEVVDKYGISWMFNIGPAS